MKKKCRGTGLALPAIQTLCKACDSDSVVLAHTTDRPVGERNPKIDPSTMELWLKVEAPLPPVMGQSRTFPPYG